MRRELRARLFRIAWGIMTALFVASLIVLVLSTLVGAGLLNQQTAADWAMALATVALVYYASATIEEAKNDRKKDRTEKTLECVYSPLYQILRQGMMRYFNVTWKNGTSILTPKEGSSADLPPSQFKFTMEEYTEILDILTRFGHLVLEPEHIRLTTWAETSKFDAATQFYYLEDREMGRTIWDNVVRHRADLQKELDKLTEA